MTLRDLDAEQARRTHELLVRLQHDVGKYATLQARWLPPEPAADVRLEAVRADLLQTARGPDGVRDVAAVMAPFVRALSGDGGPDLSSDPLVAELLAALRALSDHLPGLRQDAPEPGHVRRAMEAAGRVRTIGQQLVAATRPPDP